MTRAKHARTTTTGRKLAAGALSVPMALTMAGTAAATETVPVETAAVASSSAAALAHDALEAKPAAVKAELPTQAAGKTAAKTEVEAPETQPEVVVEKTETVEDEVVVAAEEKTKPARPAAAAPRADKPATEDEDTDAVVGKTCDQLGYTKIDKPSSTEQDFEFGTLAWGGGELTYTVNSGYVLELCIKGGNQTPLVEHDELGASGTLTHPQAISHIGYTFTKVATPVPNPNGETPVVPNPNGETPVVPNPNGETPVVPNPNGETPVVPNPNGETPGNPINDETEDAGTGTPPVVTPPTNGGVTPVVEKPVTVTPVVPVTPVSGQTAPTAGSGVISTGASAPQAFAPSFGAGVATASPSALPYTGSTTSLLLALGTGLVVVGGGLALSGRRETVTAAV